MKLPPHIHLDDLAISYEALTFPESTEKGAANVAHALGYTERQRVFDDGLFALRQDRTIRHRRSPKAAVPP